MDQEFFAAINGLAGRDRVVDMLAVALSRFGPFLLLVALAIIWFHATTGAERERRQRLVLLAAIATTGSLLVNHIFIRIWSRPRPFAFQAATLLLQPRMTLLFPATMRRSPSRLP
jgi:hypothetical protein